MIQAKAKTLKVGSTIWVWNSPYRKNFNTDEDMVACKILDKLERENNFLDGYGMGWNVSLFHVIGNGECKTIGHMDIVNFTLRNRPDISEVKVV